MMTEKVDIVNIIHCLGSETDASAHLKTIKEFALFFGAKEEILRAIKRGKPSLIDSFLEISRIEETNRLKLEENQMVLDLNRKLIKYYKTNNYTKILKLTFDFLTQTLYLCSNVGTKNLKESSIKNIFTRCALEDQGVAILYALIGGMAVPKNFNWKREDRIINQSLVLAGWAFSEILSFARDKLINLKILDLVPAPLEKMLPPIKLHLFNNKKTKKMDGIVCSNCGKRNFSARESFTDSIGQNVPTICEDCTIKKFQSEETISSFKVAVALWRRTNDLFYLFIELCLEELLDRNIVNMEAEPEETLSTTLVWANSLYKDKLTTKDKKILASVEDQSLIERAMYKIIKSANFSNLETVYRDKPKIGRNDPCPCNSGKKYKKCCGK